MRAVADTGPLVAAANRRERAHGLAAALVGGLGRDLVVPLPVLVESEQLLRSQVGVRAARVFVRTVASGGHAVQFLTPGLLRRAVEIDERFGDLNLGFTDASVMAVAERYRLPILTFDFDDFRASRPRRGFWRLVVDERRYREAIGG